jgi:hypothetical protein
LWSALSCIAILALTASLAHQETELKGGFPARDYLPLELNNQWTFRLERQENSPRFTAKVTRVAERDRVTWAHIYWGNEADVVEELWGASDRELLLKSYQTWVRSKPFVVSFEPPIPVAKSYMKKGDEWVWVGIMAQMENVSQISLHGRYVEDVDVTIGGKKYKAARIEFTTRDTDILVSGEPVQVRFKWDFVPRLGWVALDDRAHSFLKLESAQFADGGAKMPIGIEPRRFLPLKPGGTWEYSGYINRVEKATWKLEAKPAGDAFLGGTEFLWTKDGATYGSDYFLDADGTILWLKTERTERGLSLMFDPPLALMRPGGFFDDKARARGKCRLEGKEWDSVSQLSLGKEEKYNFGGREYRVVPVNLQIEFIGENAPKPVKTQMLLGAGLGIYTLQEGQTKMNLTKFTPAPKQ